jgi:hypothetical protein
MISGCLILFVALVAALVVSVSGALAEENDFPGPTGHPNYMRHGLGLVSAYVVMPGTIGVDDNVMAFVMITNKRPHNITFEGYVDINLDNVDTSDGIPNPIAGLDTQFVNRTCFQSNKPNVCTNWWRGQIEENSSAVLTFQVKAPKNPGWMTIFSGNFNVRPYPEILYLNREVEIIQPDRLPFGHLRPIIR